jgi:hypothetical protein
MTLSHAGRFLNIRQGDGELYMEEKSKDILDGQNPDANILSVIAGLAGKGTQLSITRLIKGVRFNHNASIVAVYPDSAVLHTPDIKIYVSTAGNCHLHSQLFTRVVSACLIGRNLTRCTLVLSNFAYLTRDWIERMQDRVQPSLPARMTVQCGRKAVAATLLDVEPLGMGVFVKKTLQEEAGLKPGSKVVIDVRLSPRVQWKKIPGIIVNLEPVGPYLMRAGLHLDPNPNQSCALEMYIQQRKEEILEELEETFCRALEPRRVEDLYF